MMFLSLVEMILTLLLLARENNIDTNIISS